MERDAEESAFTQLDKPGLVGQMHEQPEKLLVAPDQMEQLLRVIVGIGSNLENLNVTLHGIVKAAMELAGASYGALGMYLDLSCNSAFAGVVDAKGALPQGE